MTQDSHKPVNACTRIIENNVLTIDGHAHAVDEFSNVERLLELLDRFGVDKVALCPGPKNNSSLRNDTNLFLRLLARFTLSASESLPTFIRQHPFYTRFIINNVIRLACSRILKDGDAGNGFVRSFAKKCPERIIQIYWVDPGATDFMKALQEDFARYNFKGIKLHQACNWLSNSSVEMNQISRFAAENKLPIFIHIWSENQAHKLVTLAEKHPQAIFVILHLIGLEAIAECTRHNRPENIYLDVSPYSYTSRQRIEFAVKEFGAEHVVFGSDFPIDKSSPQEGIKRIQSMDISDGEKKQILGKNLKRLLQL